jgi:hypothetical protein
MVKNKFTLTIFFGDTDESVATCAKNFDANAFLLDRANFKEILGSNLTNNITVYTSLGDLPKDINLVYNICKNADVIFYSPPTEWSDKQIVDDVYPDKSIQGLTEKLLMMLPTSVKVHGLDIVPYQPIPLVDHRKTQKPQLWIAGCSISHGVGVSSDQRYGKLLADELGLECSFLTKPAGSISWISDQIIRSDIRTGDIVIFALPNVERVDYVYSKKLYAITNNFYTHSPNFNKIYPQHNLLSENLFYQNVNAIERVVNFCKTANAKLLAIHLLYSSNLLRVTNDKENFFVFPYTNCMSPRIQFEDIGTDNEHPGIIQHQQYKNFILEKLSS